VKDDNDRLLDDTLPGNPFDGAELFDASGRDANRTGGPPWGDPIPIGRTTQLPAFPVEVLPAWLREWTVALAEALQCPVDLPAMLALAVVSLASAKKFAVQVRHDWIEPVNLYVVIALNSGESKSPAFRAATRPVQDYVAAERNRRDPEIRAAAARADVADKHIEQLKARAAKISDPAERAKLLEVITEAVFERAAIQIPAPIRLILDDATAESVEVVLREQAGRIGIFSDEGGPFELMGGRYSDGVPNIDIYLKGHSGSPITTDRIGRAGGTVRNPAITIGLAIQPEVLTSLQGKKGFRGRGLLARFLWALPPSLVGQRDPDPTAMPEAFRAGYERSVTALLEIPADRDELGELNPRAIDLDPEAYALLVEFKGELEPSLGPSGELEAIADWGNKLAGTVIRLAGLLHLADRAGEAMDRLTDPINAEEMARAVAIAGFLRAHARGVFDKMSADPVARDARHILEWIQRNGILRFTGREVYLANRAWFKAPADTGPGLDLLIDHETIRRRPEPPRTGPGRPPTPTFDVNPGVHEHNAQNAQNPTTTAAPRDSEDSEHRLDPPDSEPSTLILPAGDEARGDR